MWLTLYNIFAVMVFSYSLILFFSYLMLVVQSYRAQARLKVDLPDDETIKYMLKSSPLTPGVSIIAPAYNEEVTIIDNVNSLMHIDYPNFEIIIVNDASTDRTMELLINEYKLVVVDKEHGGRKADGSNAGINVCSNKYFVCTDVDCIIEPMALYRMMWLVVNSHEPMIGVSATMLMSNNCTVDEGRVSEARVPTRFFPMFQQLEYLRSFLIGKLGWSNFNALPNISGGFGLFDTDVVVKSGGYDQTSMAEDMDMLLRMVTYMCNSGKPYKVAQVPAVCCWTEGPNTAKQLFRQRIRWARGLFEIISHHRKLFANPHYGFLGVVTLTYMFLFEFLAPIFEAVGFLFMIWLIIIGGVNWETMAIIFAMIYLFSILLTMIIILLDVVAGSVNWDNKPKAYLTLLFASLIEPFIYHPFVSYCSNYGYWQFIRNTTATWTPIQRRGVKKKK